MISTNSPSFGMNKTPQARKALNNIRIQKKVISVDKLVYESSPKTLVDAKEMTKKSFWTTENQGKFLRGQHLADIAEGKYSDFPENCIGKNQYFGETKVSLNEEGKPVRVFNEGMYVDQYNPKTGHRILSIELNPEGGLESIMKYDPTSEQLNEFKRNI